MQKTLNPRNRRPRSTPEIALRSLGVARKIGHLFSVTRHGALASGRRASSTLSTSRVRSPFLVALSLLCGSTAIGMGVAFFTRANLGLPPFDVLLSAVSGQSGLTHGQSAWLTSGLLLAIASLLGRRPSVWSLAMVFTNGVAVDAFAGLIVSPDTMVGRIGFCFIGLFSIIAGVALVVHSGATGGPFELLMAAAEDRGLRAGPIRTRLEVSVVCLGIIGGGIWGPATLVFALLIGPGLRFGLQAMADHGAGRDARLNEADRIEDELRPTPPKARAKQASAARTTRSQSTATGKKTATPRKTAKQTAAARNTRPKSGAPATSKKTAPTTTKPRAAVNAKRKATAAQKNKRRAAAGVGADRKRSN